VLFKTRLCFITSGVTGKYKKSVSVLNGSVIAVNSEPGCTRQLIAPRTLSIDGVQLVRVRSPKKALEDRVEEQQCGDALRGALEGM